MFHENVRISSRFTETPKLSRWLDVNCYIQEVKFKITTSMQNNTTVETDMLTVLYLSREFHTLYLVLNFNCVHLESS